MRVPVPYVADHLGNPIELIEGYTDFNWVEDYKTGDGSFEIKTYQPPPIEPNPSEFPLVFLDDTVCPMDFTSYETSYVKGVGLSYTYHGKARSRVFKERILTTADVAEITNIPDVRQLMARLFNATIIRPKDGTRKIPRTDVIIKYSKNGVGEDLDRKIISAGKTLGALLDEWHPEGLARKTESFDKTTATITIEYDLDYRTRPELIFEGTSSIVGDIKAFRSLDGRGYRGLAKMSDGEVLPSLSISSGPEMIVDIPETMSVESGLYYADIVASRVRAPHASATDVHGSPELLELWRDGVFPNDPVRVEIQGGVFTGFISGFTASFSSGEWIGNVSF